MLTPSIQIDRLKTSKVSYRYINSPEPSTAYLYVYNPCNFSKHAKKHPHNAFIFIHPKANKKYDKNYLPTQTTHSFSFPCKNKRFVIKFDALNCISVMSSKCVHTPMIMYILLMCTHVQDRQYQIGWPISCVFVYFWVCFVFLLHMRNKRTCMVYAVTKTEHIFITIK